MTKIILLNGPACSGKDTAAKMLKKLIDINYPDFLPVHLKFSAPIKLAFAGMLGADIDSEYNVLGYEAVKEARMPLLGCSYRQWQIDFSEKFMKPLYGNDIFGRLALHSIENDEFECEEEPCFIFSDCGFQIEVDTVLREFNKSDCRVFQILRPGFTFEGDSRQWVSWEGQEIRIDNSGSLENFERALSEHLDNFLQSKSGG